MNFRADSYYYGEISPIPSMDFLVPRSLERFGIFKWNHEASQLHKAVHRTRCHIDAFHLGQLKIKYPAKFFIAHRRDLRYTAVNEFPADIRFGRFLPLMKELNFIKSGDYYVPDIRLSKPNIRLGKWGRMRKEYLRLQHPVLFSEMVLTEKLYQHCAEIEAAAQHRMDVILPQLIKHYGVTEQLKAENQLEWVRQMNACVAQAEETIKGELIYAD